MSKNKKLSFEEVRQAIHSAPNERVRKMWEAVLKKLENHPPTKLESRPVKKPKGP
jgi:hypothetical protein